MEIEFQKKWDELMAYVSKRFGEKLDVEAILFIIGLQELGKNIVKLTKDQKLEVLHIAVCVLLEPYGYYEYEGRDADDWPHWKTMKNLPHLKTAEQELLIKKSMIDYFQEAI